MRSLLICSTALLIMGLAASDAYSQAVQGTKTREPSGLKPLAFQPLPVGAIRPSGWIERQLRIQANGLSGHLDLFWPDVRDSGWIGGKAEGWERMPYWLDGAVPLAYLLDDAELKTRIEGYIDYILEHQQEDGWLGPEQSITPQRRYKPRDPWPVFVMLKVLTQYHEATGDERVIPAMQRFLKTLDKQLDERPLFDWNKSRWQDLVVSIHWLYGRTGEPWLLDLAGQAHKQGHDWLTHFQDLPFKEKADKWQHESHVVNNAMAVKAPAVWYRQTGDPALKNTTRHAIEELDHYHGQFSGIFTGDECLAGKIPSQGTELCSVCEYLFSLEMATAIVGDVFFADRLERIAFNALPATFKPDMWAHQYDQQTNQVVCKVSEDRVYTTNGPDANLFGLEPNYGCCTANMHQGWPKFTTHLWMRTPDHGLAAIAYAPCEVAAEIGDAEVQVSVETEYPFRNTVAITLSTSTPVRFPLALRIPGWTEGAEVRVGDGEAQTVESGMFHVITREWSGTTSLSLRFPMPVRVERRYNDAVAIERGPLVYCLKIGEYWKYLRGEEPHADWEVFPTTHWNYGLAVDLDVPASSLVFEERPVGDMPFSPDGAPVVATVKGRMVPEWLLEKNAAAPPPPSPVVSVQPLTELVLIPYGCTNLRVTEFPLLDE